MDDTRPPEGIRHPLSPALPGEYREIEGRAGRLGYYVAGEGEPLLLIHSINAAASAYEMGPIAERARGRRVFVPDLPGFGRSDRSPRPYSIRLYTDAIHDMLDLVARETGAGAIDAVALSLSSEFLARAAVERPEAFRSLGMVTPTGFETGAHKRRGAPGSSREIPGLYKVATVPLWRHGLFNLLVSKRSIRYFLKRTFGSDNVPEAMVDYDYETAHQPGAENAPFAFLSGRLFSGDVRTLYEALSLPVCVLHGTKGDFKDYTESDWAKARANWSFHFFDTGAMVHFEQPEAFMRVLDRFLARPTG